MFVHHEERYAQPAEVLLRTWSDPAFLRYKYARLRQEPLVIDAAANPADPTILSVYRAPAAPPGLARLLVPLRLYAQQCDRWTVTSASSRSGTWQLRLDELSAVMSGTMSLKATGEGASLFVVVGQIVVSAPWLSALRAGLERLGARTLRRTLTQVAEITADWLDIHSPAPRLVSSPSVSSALAYGSVNSTAE